VAWKGDHSPGYVHVHKDCKFVVKRDLDNSQAMEGAASKRVKDLIRELEREGLL
jgi:hypothetical protein